MFSNAIVRRPTKSMVDGISSQNLGKPDYKKALEQHDAYIEALRQCGLNVHILEANESFPDWVFIEDVALLTTYCAVVTNPGTASRKKETIGIEKTLQSFYPDIEYIKAPGNLDGGDIMMVDDHFFIGLSNRTNAKGAKQLIAILKKYNLSAATVPLHEVLHLKTGINYLDKNNMLVSGEFIDAADFTSFNRIIIPEDEAYAANSLWINGRVIIPAGFPKTKDLIQKAGYQTIEVDVSEFRKLDGGLSCLSLRF